MPRAQQNPGRWPNHSGAGPLSGALPTAKLIAMLQIGVTSIGAQGRNARQTVRDRLAQEGLDPDHVHVVESVVHELLVAAFDSAVTEPLILTVEPSPAAT